MQELIPWFCLVIAFALAIIGIRWLGNKVDVPTEDIEEVIEEERDEMLRNRMIERTKEGAGKVPVWLALAIAATALASCSLVQPARDAIEALRNRQDTVHVRVDGEVRVYLRADSTSCDTVKVLPR